MHYPKGTSVKVSFGLTNKIIDSKIIHYCSTEGGSSGSPILLLDSFKVIGVHKGAQKDTKFNFNYGIFIKAAINKFKNNNNDINNYINNEDKYSINEIIRLENTNMNDMNQRTNIYGINQINYFERNINFGIINSTLSRLVKEFKLCCLDIFLPEIVNNFRLDNNNIFTWKVDMRGPKNTPYEEGIFTIRIFFPNDYPQHGPDFRFANKVYHLNACMDETSESFGHISMNFINEWGSCGKVGGKKHYSVKYALLDIFCLFYKQGVDSFYNEEMREFYVNDPAKFNEEARKWTRTYASLNN